MKRHIPNLLTASRLAMAVVVFVLVAAWRSDRPDTRLLLDMAVGVFLLAMLSDVLDGWAARRLHSSSALGRIADAFTDKILVCGTFAFLAGGNFISNQDGATAALTGIAPWMVVVLFSREFLVNAIRGWSESLGRPFPATVYGKVKMSLQCVTIIYILLHVGHLRHAAPWAAAVRDTLVWATVAVTALSALVYVGRTWRLIRTTDGNRPAGSVDSSNAPE
ncbi:MAG TPA: CDP-alcohol phosphatidyltransferase family protein [Phycisphaerae bacterium]|nr:CDP-alcohol phosphatidyltransferase family protein [Phycisphaerae bacterium]